MQIQIAASQNKHQRKMLIKPVEFVVGRTPPASPRAPQLAPYGVH